MTVVFAWIILSMVVVLFSFVPPATFGIGDYWEDWRNWNAVLWGALLTAGLLSMSIVWSLVQFGVLG